MCPGEAWEAEHPVRVWRWVSVREVVGPVERANETGPVSNGRLGLPGALAEGWAMLADYPRVRSGGWSDSPATDHPIDRADGPGWWLLIGAVHYPIRSDVTSSTQPNAG